MLAHHFSHINMSIKDTLACGNALNPSQTTYIVDATQTAICLDGAVYVEAKKSLASRLRTSHVIIAFMFFISATYALDF